MKTIRSSEEGEDDGEEMANKRRHDLAERNERIRVTLALDGFLTHMTRKELRKDHPNERAPKGSSGKDH